MFDDKDGYLFLDEMDYMDLEHIYTERDKYELCYAHNFGIKKSNEMSKWTLRKIDAYISTMIYHIPIDFDDIKEKKYQDWLEKSRKEKFSRKNIDNEVDYPQFDGLAKQEKLDRKRALAKEAILYHRQLSNF